MAQKATQDGVYGAFVVDDRYFYSRTEADRFAYPLNNILPRDYTYVVSERDEPVENYPEVKAIPRKWIDDYLQKYLDMAGETDDPDVFTYCINKINIIGNMLDDWEHPEGFEPLPIDLSWRNAHKHEK